MKLCKNESGFTLIEILIVVLIIGIIAALAIPNLLSAQKTAWGKTCFANCATLTAAAELFRIQSGGLPAAVGNMTTPVGGVYTEAVIDVIPLCPADSTNTYSFTAGSTVGCSGTGVEHE